MEFIDRILTRLEPLEPLALALAWTIAVIVIVVDVFVVNT